MILKQLLIKNLIQKTIHLGHKKNLRNQNATNIILNHRKNIDILNLNHTIINFTKVIPLIASIIKNNGHILTITDYEQFDSDFINQPVNYKKWLPGSLTNYKSLKKTQNNAFLLKRIPNLVILLTHQKTYYITKEVNKLKIPFITINDSNSNINYSQYPIPGNDNSLTAQKFYFNLIKKAIFIGYAQKLLNFKNKTYNFKTNQKNYTKISTKLSQNNKNINIFKKIDKYNTKLHYFIYKPLLIKYNINTNNINNIQQYNTYFSFKKNITNKYSKILNKKNLNYILPRLESNQ